MRDPSGITLQGHNGQKSGFSGRTITVKQVGHATLVVPLSAQQEETYLITLPQLSLEGSPATLHLQHRLILHRPLFWLTVRRIDGQIIHRQYDRLDRRARIQRSRLAFGRKEHNQDTNLRSGSNTERGEVCLCR